MSQMPSFAHIASKRTSILFDLRSGHAELIYVGSALSPDENLEALCDVRRRARHESQSDVPQPLSILPQSGRGYLGRPAIHLSRHGRTIETHFRINGTEAVEDEIRFHFQDDMQLISLTTLWTIEPSGLVTVQTKVENIGNQSLEILAIASVALPLPHWASEFVQYSGRWAAEMRQSTATIRRGTIGSSSFGGRSGFSGSQWALFHEENAGSDNGRVLACHLGWSGDAELTIERDSDGRSLLIMGPRIDAGEISLAPGEAFAAPKAYFHCGNGGKDEAMQAFHRKVLANIPQISVGRPRKVHLNSWEAFGFDYNLPKLVRLVDDAASLGVERFVLDDGWFEHRRNDQTSLGDWLPDPAIFPQGLSSLISHVQSCGLDFGLWVEPEMISPKSRLYRDHPDWCISNDSHDRPTQRNQLVLDLSNEDANAYIFERLDELLNDNAISYLKWDHNREIFPRSAKGISQTRALYALLDRLRCAHPDVEIESCASGGGRVDLEILRRCSRYWASDNNDAIERLKSNKGWFQFLPLATIGNHVGPSPNPITGRRLAMDFRAKVAMFGHMGVETDPAAMTPDEQSCLAEHINLYKSWRSVLHGGQLSAIKCADPNVYGWLCYQDGKGIALAAQTQFSEDYDAPPVTLSGLPKESRFHIRLLQPWPAAGAWRLNDPAAWERGFVLTGQALAEVGLALPLTRPETAWLISVERIG